MRRRTAQHRAIVQAFEDAARPLSPQEVLGAASARQPGLGLATVYRAISNLVQERWLTPVELPGQPARYERAGLHHHHHFHCVQCDRVYDIDHCPGNIKALAPPGFEVLRHEIVLYGRCDRCRTTRRRGQSSKLE